MRDDEFVADEARYLFKNSFELQDDIMSISSKNFKQFIGKVIHTKFPMKMLNEVTSKQQAIPRLTEYKIETITPHKNDDMATVKLKNTTLGNFFYADCYLDQYKCLNEENKFFGYLFAPGPGKKVVTSEASRAMIRAGHVGIGMSEDEVQMAAGEPDKIETGTGGQYFWIFNRSNDKQLYVEFDGSGVVKKTSVKDAPGAAKKTQDKGKSKSKDKEKNVEKTVDKSKEKTVEKSTTKTKEKSADKNKDKNKTKKTDDDMKDLPDSGWMNSNGTNANGTPL